MAKFRVLNYDDNLMMQHLKRLMLPQLRRGLQGFLYNSLRDFNAHVQRYEADRQFSATQDKLQEAKKPVTASTKTPYGRKFTNSSQQNKPDGKPRREDRLARGKSIMDTFKRSSRDIEIMRRRDLCIKCGVNGHIAADCKERWAKPSREIEALKMTTIKPVNNQYPPAEEDPIWQDTDFPPDYDLNDDSGSSDGESEN